MFFCMEIECRVKIDDVTETKRKLLGLGVRFFGKETQNDAILKEKGKEDVAQKPGSFVLRIRTTDKKTFLTFKALTAASGVWEEHEVEVNDASLAEQILTSLGFVRVLEMHKIRERGTFNGMALCLDRIKELGDFLEVEVVGEDVKEAKRKIGEVLGGLGFSEKDLIHEGYVTLLFKRKGIRYEGTG